ncbi:hypothetical protein [Amycolatopsis sp. BJA-103]|uniref:hypothetical protein n=1 Tax=Amycolatopsis sp. BJA-103 TaxID=1911175 RepID=UPI000C792612|nr:hypothetical protein [Amycolatopsis sp. BJA-103]AUI61793.1 hypothetical protein BKN51_28945 [Amycolatopsis sp. BJA-103]
MGVAGFFVRLPPATTTEYSGNFLIAPIRSSMQDVSGTDSADDKWDSCIQLELMHYPSSIMHGIMG